MKKIILGTFFAATLIIAGTTSTNAQTQKDPTLIKNEAKAKPVKAKSVSVEKAKDIVTAKPVSNAKVLPAKVKPIEKPKAVAQPAKAKTLKKATMKPVKATPVGNATGTKND